ncbi:glutathione S-transferase [Bradyrhizobium liaoningense]
MRLIGMLDSPYVRRVAISLRTMELPFSHEPLSVFDRYEAFSAVNPVVKAPTFVTDDNIVLMDSTLIIEHLERLVAPGHRLAPTETAANARAQRVVGLALAACEKTVQIVYERGLRPPEKHHQPWIDRVKGQLEAAYRLLEHEIAGAQPWLFESRPLQADISSAVAWRFTQNVLPGLIREDLHPSLTAFSAHAEKTEAFTSFPPD